MPHLLPLSPIRDGTNQVKPVSVVCNLGIYVDADVSTRSHVTKTLPVLQSCVSAVEHSSGSVPRSVLQSLVLSLILHWLDYGNATLADIPSRLIKRMKLVMNSAARLLFSASRYDCITPQLQWLRVTERIKLKLSVLVYRCLHQTASPYVADEFHRGPSAYPLRLIVITCRTRFSAIGDRAFPVCGTLCRKHHDSVVNVCF